MQKNAKSELIDWIKSFVLALAIVLFIKFFLFDIIPIENVSMQPTLYERDRVFLNIVQYRLMKPGYSDVVIFTPPVDKESFYIKRVIGLPGETISIKGGYVYINDKKLDEQYLPAGTITDGNLTLKIPEDCVFVMGDNRGDSQDSREFGPISIKSIKGHAQFRVFPFNKLGKL